MKKRFALIVCSLAMVCWSGMALAAVSVPSTVSLDIKYAFTGDNIVSSFKLFNAGNDLIHDFEVYDNNWRTAVIGSAPVTLNQDQGYYLQWVVRNITPPDLSNDNPIAFVGQFDVGGKQYLSSADTSIWSVTGEAENIFLESYGKLAGPNKWTSVGTDGLAPYILSAAEWIGLGKYPGTENSMTVTAYFTAPVPLPGAALLFGSGLLGLVGLRRRQIV